MRWVGRQNLAAQLCAIRPIARVRFAVAAKLGHRREPKIERCAFQKMKFILHGLMCWRVAQARHRFFGFRDKDVQDFFECVIAEIFVQFSNARPVNHHNMPLGSVNAS